MRIIAPLLVLSLSGCLGSWKEEWNKPDTSADTESDTDESDPIETDSAMTADTGGKPIVEVTESITSDTEWTPDNVYLLKDLIYIESGAQLDIEAGTLILGDRGSALISTRDGVLNARGTEDEPVIFTSAKAEGSRKAGDWGGVIVLGNAPVNKGDNVFIEGVPSDEPRGLYGGTADADNCGLLEYVEIQFPGFEIFEGNEINGLTFGGCGSNTIVRNVHVHDTVDDGVEVFGGSVNMKNIIITRAGDDSLDWDQGWQGKIQYLIIQQSVDSDNGFESDNSGCKISGWDGDERPVKACIADGVNADHDTAPRSAPTLSNVTMIGSNDQSVNQRGMLLREGTGAEMKNFIMQGFTNGSIDINHLETAQLTSMHYDGDSSLAPDALNWKADSAVTPAPDDAELSFEGFIVYDIGSGSPGTTFYQSESASTADDDFLFDEDDFFENTVGVSHADPLLPDAVYNATAPSFIPAAGSPASSGVTPPVASFFDSEATYMGAVKPASTKGWYDWCTFPEN